MIWLVDEDAVEGRDYDLERMLPFWQLTGEQDWQICERQQKGVESPAYVPGPLSKFKEYNLDAFLQWYVNTLRAAVRECMKAPFRARIVKPAAAPSGCSIRLPPGQARRQSVLLLGATRDLREHLTSAAGLVGQLRSKSNLTRMMW
jgi:hypothetical protein